MWEWNGPFVSVSEVSLRAFPSPVRPDGGGGGQSRDVGQIGYSVVVTAKRETGVWEGEVIGGRVLGPWESRLGNRLLVLVFTERSEVLGDTQSDKDTRETVRSSPDPESDQPLLLLTSRLRVGRSLVGN